MDYLIMCIGNPEGGDDAVGPYIAEKLKKETSLTVLNCGVIPENYTSVVKKNNPGKLVIIDAVDMGLEQGEIRIVPKEKIGLFTVSTHGMPISLLIQYLEQYVKNIVLIGIQPKTMSGEITAIVKKSANDLIVLIKKNGYRSILEIK